MTTYNAHNFIEGIILIIYDFFFNTFSIPNYSNVKMGWVLIVAVTMGIMIKTILNIPRSIPSLKKERQGIQNGQ